MAAKVRYWTFAGMLAAGVVLAVSAIGAQEPRDNREADARREFRVLDGRGSHLGVLVRDVESGKAAAGGVEIETVDAGSPAERAGLKAGDVVVEFDGERVRSARQFTRLVQETPEGRAVSLSVMRDGQRQSLTATPEARALSWNVDGDRIRRDVERSLEGLRDFRWDGPPMNFRFDGDLGRLVIPSGRGRLGVTVDTVSDQLAEYFGAPEGGALVTNVLPDSPAARAGMKAGDVITAIDGQHMHDAADVSRAMSRALAGGELKVDYLRDKKPGSASVTIEAAPGDERSRSLRRRPV